MEDAVRLLREMEAFGGGGVLFPDVRVYTSVLRTLAAAASFQPVGEAAGGDGGSGEGGEGGGLVRGSAGEAMKILSEMRTKGATVFFLFVLLYIFF